MSWQVDSTSPFLSGWFLRKCIWLLIWIRPEQSGQEFMSSRDSWTRLIGIDCVKCITWHINTHVWITIWGLRWSLIDKSIIVRCERCLVNMTSLGNVCLLCSVISDTYIDEKIIVSLVLQTRRFTITSCYG